MQAVRVVIQLKLGWFCRSNQIIVIFLFLFVLSKLFTLLLLMVTTVVVKVRDQLYVNLNFTSSQITLFAKDVDSQLR
jgi:hypothetical protein